MDNSQIERELAEAHAEFVTGTRRLRIKRQAAVMRARAAGLSKYRIAAIMGVKAPTVAAIISSAERGET